MILTSKLARQRGTEDVMIYLSKEAHNDKVKSILFLMPCHATPYYSTLHCNLPMRFLDCSPRWVSGTAEMSHFFCFVRLGYLLVKVVYHLTPLPFCTTVTRENFQMSLTVLWWTLSVLYQNSQKIGRHLVMLCYLMQKKDYWGIFLPHILSKRYMPRLYLSLYSYYFFVLPLALVFFSFLAEFRL